MMTETEIRAAHRDGQTGREIVERLVAEGGWTEAGASEYVDVALHGGDVIPRPEIQLP